MKNFTENTFWAKTKEEKLEKPGLFDELTKTFAAKGAPKKTESGDALDKKPAAKKKGKDLKIIDPKSAQNLCKCNKCIVLVSGRGCVCGGGGGGGGMVLESSQVKTQPTVAVVFKLA